MIVFAAMCISFVVGKLAYTLFPPLPRLAERLSPYDTVAKVRLQGSLNSLSNKPHNKSRSFILEFLSPMYESFSRIVGKLAAIDNDEAMTLRLEQAGLRPDVDSYRTSVVKKIMTGIGVGLLLGAGIGNVTALLFFPCIFGFIAFSKSRSTIDKKILHRRSVIRSEMYTIDQLLALHIRTGAGITQALQSISRRVHGIVADDIATILNRAHSGIAIDESLYMAARTTPEPHAMRTYKLLAAASHRGVDLTQGLLDLAHDLRRSLREDVKATSAKRRAAMLIPTIGILAPIMLLFVAAPIPSIVLGGH